MMDYVSRETWRASKSLCNLIIGLTSWKRVFAALMCNGRLTVSSLLHHTSLPSRQIRHTLAVLLQQHLAFWYTADDGTTYYEANWTGAYALARSGKLTKAIEDRLGPVAGELLTTLLLSGHARVADLAQAYSADSRSADTEAGNGKSLPNGDLPNGNSNYLPNGQVSSTQSFQPALVALVSAGLVATVHESHFRSEADNRAEAEILVKSWDRFKDDLKGPQKLEFAVAVDKKLLDWKFTNEAAIKILAVEPAAQYVNNNKRKLGEANDRTDALEKRRRLDISGSGKAVHLDRYEQVCNYS